MYHKSQNGDVNADEDDAKDDDAFAAAVVVAQVESVNLTPASFHRFRFRFRFHSHSHSPQHYLSYS